MGKNINVILATILVFLVVADISNAWNFRKLVDSPPKKTSNSSSDAPILSPKFPVKQLSPVGKEKKIEPDPASQTGKDGSSKDKEVTKDMNVTPPPVDVKEHIDNNTGKDAVKEKGKESEGKEGEKANEKSAEKVNEKSAEKANEKAVEKEEPKEEQKAKEKEKAEEKEEEKEEQIEKEKEDSKTNVPVGSGDSCDTIETKCHDSKSITACIVDHDSKALVLLIQNKGDSSLKVDITTSPSRSKQQVIDLPKLQNKQVNLADTRLNKITLTAGNGDCVLNLGPPVPQGNFFQWMPSYTKFMTPIYGAYLILAITFIAGGVWACCWFTKRKGHRGIPYQELEMSRPESAVAVETAEGWDEVWDDDWDEENAVRSPGGRSISAKGLTSRNPKKDDWEDWDD